MDNSIVSSNVDTDEHHVIFPYKWNNEKLRPMTRTRDFRFKGNIFSSSLCILQHSLCHYLMTTCLYLQINWTKWNLLIHWGKFVRMSSREKKRTQIDRSINQTSHSPRKSLYPHISTSPLVSRTTIYIRLLLDVARRHRMFQHCSYLRSFGSDVKGTFYTKQLPPRLISETASAEL